MNGQFPLLDWFFPLVSRIIPDECFSKEIGFFLCVHVYVSVCVYVRVYVNVCVSVCVYARVYVHVCVSVCVYVRVCVYVCVLANVMKSKRFLKI